MAKNLFDPLAKPHKADFDHMIMTTNGGNIAKSSCKNSNTGQIYDCSELKNNTRLPDWHWKI